MHVFFQPDDIAVGTLLLTDDESHHALKVMRLAAGTAVWVTNGQGLLAKATLVGNSGKGAVLEVVEVENIAQPAARLHIAIAPTKNIERTEFFLEKATEMGISHITLLYATRSERKQARLDRLEKVVVSAAKQSIKAWFPIVDEVQGVDSFIKTLQPATTAYIAHCNAGEKLPFATALKPMADICVLIGPEGDFTPAEVLAANNAGVQSLSLGNQRLRTETAALFVCAGFNFVNSL